jgi:hypothetical protein
MRRRATNRTRYHMDAIVRQHVSSSALIALVLVVGLAGCAALALGAVAAVPLLAVAATVAAAQRTALARSLVVTPEQRRARLRTAASLAVVCAAAIGSWVYHVNRYDELGDATVLLHKLVSVLSFLGVVGFGLAELFTRTQMRNAHEGGRADMDRRGSVLGLVLSAAVAIGVLLYAFSLDEWGDTGSVVFPIVSLAAVAIAVAFALRIATTSKHQ